MPRKEVKLDKAFLMAKSVYKNQEETIYNLVDVYDNSKRGFNRLLFKIEQKSN